MAESEHMQVKVGVDLNPTKSPNDKKTYRHLTLLNGIECILVSQPFETEGSYDEDTDDEESSIASSSVSSSTASFSKDDINKQSSRKRSAVAVAVNVGSWSDPDGCHGCAHFLEHLLFMGSRKYPQENYFDEYVTKKGGFVNAYTKAEETVYHFTINKSGLFHALDILAQFFVDPLLSKDAVDRELESIQSEFDSARNRENNRLLELYSHTCKREHPAAKFSWGNLESIKTEAEGHELDPYKLLWEFYKTYYGSENMKLVVLSSHNLDEIQQAVLLSFSNARSAKVKPHEFYEIQGLPFEDSKDGNYAMHKLYYILPMHNTNILRITFQLPSLCKYYKSKPGDYLAHLLGHESDGSLLAVAKAKGWANSLLAGEQDEIENSSFTLLFISFSLTEKGVQEWKDIVSLVFEYIGLLKRHGCAEWIYEELRDIAAMEYSFAEEDEPEDTVSELAEAMLDRNQYEKLDLLSGAHLIKEFRPEIIQMLLDFMIPERSRIEIVSKQLYLRGKNFDFRNLNQSEKHAIEETTSSVLEAPKQIERRFGTTFWSCEIQEEMDGEWNQAYTLSASCDKKITKSGLTLPRRNPYIAKDFTIRPFAQESSNHLLLGAAVKVQTKIGRRTQWLPGFIVQYNKSTGKFRIAFEFDCIWFSLAEDTKAAPGDILLMNEGSIKCKLIAGGNGGFQKFTLENIWEFGKSPPIGDCFNPQKSELSNEFIELWFLRDRVFLVPRSDLFLHFIFVQDVTATAYGSVLQEVAVRLIIDALNEELYMASMAELNIHISRTLKGRLNIRLSGYNDKLLKLLQNIGDELFTPLDVDNARERHSEINLSKRFQRIVESMERSYSNLCNVSSSYAKRTRLECLRPEVYCAQTLSDALKEIKRTSLMDLSLLVHDTFKRIYVKSFFHGNFSDADIKSLHEILMSLFGRYNVGIVKEYDCPVTRILSIPSGVKITSKRTSKNAEEKNNCVEAYFEIANLVNVDSPIHTRMILDIIEHLMEEPLYDELRTRQQLGYNVSCSTRHNENVLGFLIKVVSSNHNVTSISERIEEFLDSFEEKCLKPLWKANKFQEQLEVLAELKLADDLNMGEASELYNDEIAGDTYEFHRSIYEAAGLQNVKLDDVVKSYKSWLEPRSSLRKALFVLVSSQNSCESDCEQGRSFHGSVVHVHTPRETIHNGTYKYHCFRPVFRK